MENSKKINVLECFDVDEPDKRSCSSDYSCGRRLSSSDDELIGEINDDASDSSSLSSLSTYAFDPYEFPEANTSPSSNPDAFKHIDLSAQYVCVSFIGADIYNGCGCIYDPSHKYSGKFDYFLRFNDANKPAIKFILKYWKWRGKIYNNKSYKKFIIYDNLFDGSDIIAYDKFTHHYAVHYTVLNNPRNFSYLGLDAEKVFKYTIKVKNDTHSTPSEPITILFSESTNPSCSLCERPHDGKYKCICKMKCPCHSITDYESAEIDENADVNEAVNAILSVKNITYEMDCYLASDNSIYFRGGKTLDGKYTIYVLQNKKVRYSTFKDVIEYTKEILKLKESYITPL
jgi:hypothetical protein